jgi:hypothetical protein
MGNHIQLLKLYLGRKRFFLLGNIIFVTFIYLSFTTDLSAQWAYRLDPLNLAFQNYNLGLEHRKGKSTVGLDVSYLNKGWVWQTEMPGYAKSRGFRINIDYKISPEKISWVYAGIILRMEKLHFGNLSHWQASYNYTRDDQRFIAAGKLGLRVGKGPFKVDFGIGPGLRFLKRRERLLSIYSYPSEITKEEFTVNLMRSLWHNSDRFVPKIIPVVHLQTTLRIGK